MSEVPESGPTTSESPGPDQYPMVDFDHHSEDFHSNRRAKWADMGTKCPVAYNPRYGGFWVVSGYQEVAKVSRDSDTFSSRFEPEPVDGIQYLGITGIPRVRGIPPAGIAEVEGPIHQVLRRVMNPFMLPPAVEALRPFMDDVAGWFLDQKIAEGHMDLVLDLANPVPAILTMKLIGLPCDNWQRYAELFHATVAYRPGTPEHRHALSLVSAMVEEFVDEAAARRRAPRQDLLTSLVEMEVEGRPLSDDEISAVLWNLVGGGLDTTTSLTSLSLFYLDEHPDLRRQLIQRPDLMTAATEEFLRYFSVNETLTRTCTRDVELGGRHIEKGQYVMLSWLAANLDETEFDRSDQVVLDRAPNRHLAFGVGPHRCIGMHLARTMFQVLLSQVLARIPEYRIDREATRFYQGNPELAGVVTMPAQFEPGKRSGPDRKPF